MRLSTYKCPQCTAPLSVESQDTDVRCTYCGNLIHVERRRPPPVADAAQNVVYVERPARPVTGSALLLALGIALVPIGIMTGPDILQTLHRYFAPFPAVCHEQGELLIVGKSFADAKSEPLIRVEPHCRLIIRDCNLEAEVVVQGKGAAEVKIEHSVLNGRSLGIELDNNAKIELTENSKVRGDIAIAAGSGLDVRIDHSEVAGNEVGIQAGMSAKVVIHQGTLNGSAIGLHALHGLTLLVEEGKIESAEDGVVADFAAQLNVTKSKLHGGRRVFAFSAPPSALSLVDSAVEGAQVFDRKDHLTEPGAAP